MIALAIAALTSLALLAAMFVPLERAFPARRGQPIVRPELVTDGLFFFGQYLAWSALAVLVLAFVEERAATYVPRELRALVSGAPLWARGIAVVVLGDLAVYWYHRASHAFEPLWRFHAVHHSAHHLDWLAAHREHPVDGVLTQLCMNLPAFVLGFPLEALAALVAFRGIWAVFVHANVRLPLGPLRVVFGAPELHHWHHARVPETRHNFANLAPWIDVVFGSYHRPRGEETYPLGLTDPWPRAYAAQLLHPFRLFARGRRRPSATLELGDRAVTRP
jgi:sterol desaturase/sphingolipid hydroxylase (fatty acid hydroxylase superfamily)